MWADLAAELEHEDVPGRCLAGVRRLIVLAWGRGWDAGRAGGRAEGGGRLAGRCDVLDELESWARSAACSAGDLTVVDALADVEPERADRLREDVDAIRAAWLAAARGVDREIPEVVLAQRRGEPGREAVARRHEARVWAGWPGRRSA